MFTMLINAMQYENSISDADSKINRRMRISAASKSVPIFFF